MMSGFRCGASRKGESGTETPTPGCKRKEVLRIIKKIKASTTSSDGAIKSRAGCRLGER
jgi:hypothetical protein